MTVSAKLISDLFRAVADESGLHVLNLSMEIVSASFSPVALDRETGEIRYGSIREGGVFVFDRRRPVGKGEFIIHFAGWAEAQRYVDKSSHLRGSAND